MIAMLPTPLIPSGFSGLLMAVSLVSVVFIFGMLLWTLWTVRNVTRESRRLFCPVRLRRVRVLFRLAPTGARTDVLHCSVFGRRPITCGKVCLHTPSAA